MIAVLKMDMFSFYHPTPDAQPPCQTHDLSSELFSILFLLDMTSPSATRHHFQLDSELFTLWIDALSRARDGRILLFDNDLMRFGLDNPRVAALLSAFLARHPFNQLIVIAVNDAWLRGASRFVTLAQLHGHQIECRLASGESLRAQQSLALLPDQSIYKPVAAAHHGFSYEHDPEQFAALQSLWDALYENSEPMPPFHALGL